MVIVWKCLQNLVQTNSFDDPYCPPSPIIIVSVVYNCVASGGWVPATTVNFALLPASSKMEMASMVGKFWPPSHKPHVEGEEAGSPH